MKVKLQPKLTCRRCGHRWLPRKEVVYICPSCKSPHWQTSKEVKK